MIGMSNGFDVIFRCEVSETIATIPLGYADGYLRNMFGVGCLTTMNGRRLIADIYQFITSMNKY